jgi:hypothetical protein
MAISPVCFGFVLLAAALVAPQDIPAGVHYKKAPDAVNGRALAKLTKFFKDSPSKADFGGMSKGPLVCMPGMWMAISEACPRELMAAKHATFMVPNDADVQKFEGRIFKTPQEKLTFWKLLHKRAAGRQPVIRKAKSNELKYYWALIPYDIEEPVWIADFGKDKVLCDFMGGGDGKDPQVLAIEMIGGVK